MPTHDETDSWQRDWRSLSPEQRAQFRAALRKFLADLPNRQFRPGLRVTGVRSGTGIYELTWADDGRATFEFGQEVHAGSPNIIWRRIGAHEILDNP